MKGGESTAYRVQYIYFVANNATFGIILQKMIYVKIFHMNLLAINVVLF